MHRAGSSGLPDEGVLAVIVGISSRHKTRATLGKEMEERGEGEGEERGKPRGRGDGREKRGERGKRGQGEANRKSRWRGTGERRRGRGKEGWDIILLSTITS